jgi:hypothetical protein
MPADPKASRAGHGVLDEDVELCRACAAGGAHALDVEVGLAGRLTQVGEPSGPILEGDGQVLHSSSSLFVAVRGF